MAERIFNYQKFHSYWENLSKEQRSPDGREIVLTVGGEGAQMSLIDKEGNIIDLPWRYSSDEAGISQLINQLQASGIAMGSLDDYMVDDAEALDEPKDIAANVVGKGVLTILGLVGVSVIAYRTGRTWRGLGSL